MARVKVELLGVEEATRETNKITKEIREALDEIIQSGAEILRQEASDRAPRRTGNLANNIIVETVETTTASVSKGVGPNKQAFYGLFVELGTVKMSPHPFLLPAYESKKEEIVKEVLRRMRELVSR